MRWPDSPPTRRRQRQRLPCRQCHSTSRATRTPYLAGRLDLLAGGGRSTSTDEDGDENGDASASDVHLKTWSQRRTRDLGEPSPGGSPPPLIDCVHKLMQLWTSGEQCRVDA